MPTYVNGIGPLQPKLMIIGESPGKYEDEQGIPFVGPTGAMLNDFLHKAGIKRDECYITNVVKYRPPMNDLKKLHLINVDVNDSIKQLWDNEIHPLRPNCILAVGDLALNATTGYSGILNYRGSILKAIDGKTKVVPTIHPAALFNRQQGSDEVQGGLDYVYSKLIQFDINRAVEESQSAEINLPSRNLTVAHNSLDVFRFFGQYENLGKAAFDIESINCIPVCVGFAFNRNHALSIPLLRSIGKVQLTDMGENELDECWRMIDTQLRRLKLIGQNAKYDDFKLSLTGFNCANVYSDILLKSRVIFPELPSKKLHTLSSLWTREPYYKEEGKEFKLGKSNISQLFLYNAKDCAVTYEVDEEMEVDLLAMQERFKVPLHSYYYNYVMKKHKFYLSMENQGFKVDLHRQAELKVKYKNLQDVVHSQLITKLGHEVNVKSYPRMFQLLYKEMKFPVRKRDPTSEDSIVALLGNHCKGKDGPAHKAILEDVLEERRIRDQRSRYINFHPDYDSRCRTSFNIMATETCRSSTGILQKPIRPRKIGLAFHTISKHGRLAKDIRSMLIPDKGMVFLQVDASQCQARIVAVLSKDWELLTAFDTVDIHRRTAGLCFGMLSNLDLSVGHINIVDDLEKDGPQRFTGKKVRHAGNFDMRKRRFMTEFNTDAQKFGINMTISEWKAGQMLDIFHAASPKLRNVFHAEIKQVIDSTRTLIGPHGNVRVFNGRMDDELYKEAYAHIPQCVEANLVQGAALKIDAELNDDIEHMWLSENHDSLTMQVPSNNWEPYGRLMVKHMREPIDFGVYCSLKRDYKLVIPADLELADTHYGDFHKVKL